MNAQECIDMLGWRYAVKKFDAARKIPSRELEAVLEAVHLSPSSFGLQLWRFVHVVSPEIRERLRAVSWDQHQVTDASDFLVFCVRRDFLEEDMDRYLRRISEVRGVSLESLALYKERMQGLVALKSPEELAAWMERQVYIALGFAMNTAASMGIDCCPLEGLEPESYDALLGIEQSPYRCLCALALGYRDEEDKYAHQLKVRFELNDVIQTV